MEMNTVHDVDTGIEDPLNGNCGNMKNSFTEAAGIIAIKWRSLIYTR
jgi:hypothetical protein